MDGERCDLARIPLIFRGGGRVPALHRLRVLLRPTAPSGVVPARPTWLWMAGAAVCLSPRLTAAAVCASQIPRQYHPRLAAVAHAEPFRPIRPRSEAVVDHQHPVPLSCVVSAARTCCAAPVQLLSRCEGRFRRPPPVQPIPQRLLRQIQFLRPLPHGQRLPVGGIDFCCAYTLTSPHRDTSASSSLGVMVSIPFSLQSATTSSMSWDI